MVFIKKKEEEMMQGEGEILDTDNSTCNINQ